MFVQTDQDFIALREEYQFLRMRYRQRKENASEVLAIWNRIREHVCPRKYVTQTNKLLITDQHALG